MKKLLLLFTIVFSPFVSFSQCPTSDITLITQEDVDNFKINYPNCSELQESLTIVGSGISNLNGLNAITTIHRNLTIGNNYSNATGLVDLSGLDLLTTVNGILEIKGNSLLLSLTGLNKLAYIGKRLIISKNSVLNTLEGLQSLKSVGLELEFADEGGLWIQENPKLTGLSALISIEKINGFLVLRKNNLSSLSGLDNLLSVEVQLTVEYEKIIDATGLGKLEYVNHDLSFRHCENLTNLNGFNSLIRIGGFLNIEENNSFLNFKGVEKLTSINNVDDPRFVGLHVNNNPMLSSLEGLENIVTVGNLIFYGNESLTDFSGLTSLKTITNEFNVLRNNIFNFSGLDNLEVIQGDLIVSENMELIGFTGLGKLNSISKQLRISNNPKINNLTGFASIKSINRLELVGNNLLSSLDGIESLESLGEGMSITLNNTLTDISALSNVANVTAGSMFISRNLLLENINGLENFNQTDTYSIIINENEKLRDISALTNWNQLSSVSISKNPELNDCDIQSICELITSEPNRVNISENGLSCSDKQELIILCNPDPQCPTEDIILSTQLDIDNFSTNYEYCTKPQFGITIEGDDITNLNGLAVITDIGGNLVIQNTPNLSNLDGLNSLVLVNGDVVINNNDSLSNIRAIRYINGFEVQSLTISNNPMLSDCDIAVICNYISENPDGALIFRNGVNCSIESEIVMTCGSLCPDRIIILSSQEDIDNFKINYPNCTVPNGIAIGGSDITNLNGLNTIMASTRDFIIGNASHGTSLVDFSGLESLRRVEETIIITDNLKLTSLNGLESLEYIGEDLRIGRGISGDRGNPLLQNLLGLKKLSSIGGKFSIIDANSLTDLNGLEALSSIGTSIEIIRTKKLTSLQGLDNIQNEDIKGNFEIAYNEGLVSLGDFTSLTSIKGRLTIDSNNNLMTLSGFDNVTSISGNVAISRNDKLSGLSGLNSLTSVGGLRIQNNSSFTSLEGLNNLNSITGGLTINFHRNLETLSALANLKSVSGISITGNDQIVDLNGLNNLEVIKENLSFSSNNKLKSISEIGNLNLDQVSFLSIKFNPELSVCEEINICNYLNYSDKYSIQENAIGCNSYEEVIEACNTNLNTIKGVLMFDGDQNGWSDLDYKILDTKVTTTNGTSSYSAFTNSEGKYSLFVNKGIYNSTVNINSPYFIIDPNSQESSFTTDGNIDIIDFCVTTEQTKNDVNITIVPKSEARPGFDIDYQIVYENVGTTVLDGTISVQIDDVLQSHITSIPSEDTASSNALSFNFNGLNPFEKRKIDITMNTFAPPIVNDGDLIVLNATITTNEIDETPSDNVFELRQIVVNSFDPNDKNVLQGTSVDIDNVNEYLNYIIRFQNIGSASAINVRINDILSDQLDWETLKPVSASHEYVTKVTNGNSVKFLFDNINLPSEQDDPEGSNGFIAFKIKPKSGIQIGDIVTGKADIFFDFNAPIATNTVITEITTVLSTPDFETVSVNIFPIPSKNRVYIKNPSTIEIKSVHVYTVNGSVLLEQIKDFKSIDISGLSKGVYFLKISSNRGEFVKKIIKN